MTEDLIIELLTDVFFTSFLILLPILGVSLIVGLIISIFQATTSIQEMTLTFVPKILITAIAIIVSLPWMMDKLITMTLRIFELITTVIK
ncbi:MAG: flagellar biosynthetic protein FliQ [Ignavibacteriae bacterium]|nr:flagellar biosynthetic protein FliQ [Ignavibacteriota bacterium]NOG97150.1 flagellar biosynthetic protein FliQ [Ignavibacteriota bacterium]